MARSKDYPLNFNIPLNIFIAKRVNIVQIMIGVAVLFIGSLVYLIDRPPDQTYFVYATDINISLHNTFPNLFGFIGNYLPDFIHVFSFILITAGLMACGKRGYLIISLSWFLIDMAFELGQKFSSWSSEIIPEWFEGVPFLENTQNYFLRGTFDFMDLFAITIGAVLGYLVLLTTNKRRESV